MAARIWQLYAAAVVAAFEVVAVFEVSTNGWTSAVVAETKERGRGRIFKWHGGSYI